MAQNYKIVIVGAGLSGLTLGYLLSKHNVEVLILEASDRVGGRIQTIKGTLETPLELGATWFSNMHPRLIQFLEELNIEKYPQFSRGKSLFQTKSFEPPQEFYVPEAEAPSYRIAGGTQQLTDALARKLNSDTIKLNSRLVEVNELGKELHLKTEDGQNYITNQLIFCLPPKLISPIKFTPELPKEVTTILPRVQTWMEGSIKFVVEYKNAFWREDGYSGMLFSHSGIVSEMYDHTNIEKDKFGFTGFLNSGAASYTFEVRKKLVLEQLQQLLGDKALDFITYNDKVWVNEFIGDGKGNYQQPHQNNGHPIFQNSYLDHKLFFCGTETANEFPGYMEGAIQSAHRVFNSLGV
ncbi:flavin monoamine oxidase family protein [Zunongwangia pacifica]|uniref:FAD-dependent oxidoreductase n=1 Tax=Zunongwangia pacifica TaxID=2911062 RepID=A0A9X1ZTC5_9FLAO|nr:NAD(P)/FAD-dependent oxidoreductase [Zunongwangia pacifica]MCL6217265.1 FAD-dependent oxidoreductase [Zunongwangia pacifica]